MSRSYKKNPIANDSRRKSTKRNKQLANKKIRKINNIPNGNAYKKFSESYDIRDFSIRDTWEEAKDRYEKDKYFYSEWTVRHYPTLKDFYRFWFKNFKGK